MPNQRNFRLDNGQPVSYINEVENSFVDPVARRFGDAKQPHFGNQQQAHRMSSTTCLVSDPTVANISSMLGCF